MAYIVRDNYDGEYSNTDIEFTSSETELKEFFVITRVGPNTIERASWSTGTPIPEEVVPRNARIVRGDAIYDWCRMLGGALLVSAAFKACVEELEPGQHGFFPVSVVDLRGLVKPGPYFIFNVVGRINSIIESQSNLKAVGRGDIEGWQYTRRIGEWSCALASSCIGKRACWTEVRFSGEWFFSDSLATLMRERGLRGFHLTDHCEEVSI